MMLSVDGLEVCRRLRETGDRTPILMLTARDSIGDRVAGLDAVRTTTSSSRSRSRSCTRGSARCLRAPGRR